MHRYNMKILSDYEGFTPTRREDVVLRSVAECEERLRQYGTVRRIYSGFYAIHGDKDYTAYITAAY